MFSQLSIIQKYVGLCVFSLPISLVMIERIYILCLVIIVKSEVCSITHCLGLGHKTMVCAVCLSVFLYSEGWSYAFPNFSGATIEVWKWLSTVETLYNTINFCWSTHKRHSIARLKGRGMGCLLWVQRATYCVDLSILSSIKYLL